MIVFQNLNPISIIPALLLGIMFEVYYLRSSAGLSQSSIIQRFQKWLPIKCLPIANAELLEGARYYDYGIESLVYGRVDQLLPLKLIKGLGDEFNGIIKLDEKLRLTLASYLSYQDIGTVTLFLSASRQYRRIYFLHTAFHSYVHHSCNTPDFVSFHHFFFPSDDLACLSTKIVSKILWQVKRVVAPKNQQGESSSVDETQRHYFLETAVLFHHSLNYGKMFKKVHYFSTNNSSRLHRSNVLNLVIDRQKKMTDVIGDKDFVMYDLHRMSNWSIILTSIRFFFSKIVDVRSLDEFLGVIFLTRMHYGIRAWKLALLQYPNLKNVIIDYDILFPKSLALALESKGIRTIALQERGSASFGPIYSVIADTYLFCGGLFTEYGQRNLSIAYRRGVDFGPWRSALLLGAKLPAFEDLSMQKNGKRDAFEFTSVIAVLGWFTTEQDAESLPFTNFLANVNLHNHAKSLASAFPDSAVVLRLKIFTDFDRRILLDSFLGLQNVFVCDEYSKDNASYALCKRADVIVSVQTSLADECLAAGKKVVVLDSTHNLKNICTDIYPKEFHFAFASDTQHMLDLVSRCLLGDAELIARYDRLKTELAGEFDLRTPDIIPDTLEQFLA